MIEEFDTPKGRRNTKDPNDSNIVIGVILVTLGVLFLIARYFPEIDFGDLWPYILIIVGIVIMIRGRRSK